MENKFENRFSRIFPNLSNYLLGATLLCYLSGFAITNLYLGSLGIVNLDILRSRYILAGLLFLLFLAAIAYLVNGLIQTVRKYTEEPSWKILLRTIWHSLENIFIIYIAIVGIAVFAGSSTNFPKGFPIDTIDIPWKTWLDTELESNLRSAAGMLISMAIVFIIFIVTIIIINPKTKEEKRRPRKELILEIWSGTINNIGKILLYIFIIYLGLAVWFSISSILQLIGTNQVGLFPTSRSSIFSQSGWTRYLITLVLIYGFIGIYLLSLFLIPQSNTESVTSNPITKHSAWIYLVAWAIIIIVPVYSIGVYPYLPQQIGGGHVIPVEITTSSDDINSSFSNSTNGIYMIDRAPNTSLFLIVDQPTENYKIMEVSNDLIESIVFYESP